MAYDLYAPMHKACRSLVYNISIRMQVNDFTDRANTNLFLESLYHHLDLLHEHNASEERIVHPRARPFLPQMVEILERDHKEIERRASLVRSVAKNLPEVSSKPELATMGVRLNKAFNDFVTFFLWHINYEENTFMPGASDHFSDGQLASMRAAIIGENPLERNIEWLIIMFFSLNNLELIELISALKSSNMSDQALQVLMGLVNDLVGQERWQAISRKVA